MRRDNHRGHRGRPFHHREHGGMRVRLQSAVKHRVFFGGSVIARLLTVLLLSGAALAQNIVHYTTTTTNVKYLFATAEPVVRLKSGDILDTNRTTGSAVAKRYFTLV